MLQEDICSADDILCHHPEFEGSRRGIESMTLTIAALLTHAHNNIDPQYGTEPVHYTRKYTEERVISNFNFHSNEEFLVEEDEEEFSYENNNDIIDNAHFNPIYVSTDGTRNRGYGHQNNKVQFVTPFYKQDGVLTSDHFDIYDTDVVDAPRELTEIEENAERYDRSKMNLNIENNLNKQLNDINTTIEPAMVDEEKRFQVTCLCLGTFFFSLIILFLYPL